MEAIKAVDGVSAEVVKTGDEALRLLRESKAGKRAKFDIVFVDLQLRGSEAQGIDVIRQVRKQFPATHTIIVSGTIDREAINFLSSQENKGAYLGIISKPLEVENLHEIINKHHMRDAGANI